MDRYRKLLEKKYDWRSFTENFKQNMTDLNTEKYNFYDAKVRALEIDLIRMESETIQKYNQNTVSWIIEERKKTCPRMRWNNNLALIWNEDKIKELTDDRFRANKLNQLARFKLVEPSATKEGDLAYQEKNSPDEPCREDFDDFIKTESGELKEKRFALNKLKTLRKLAMDRVDEIRAYTTGTVVEMLRDIFKILDSLQGREEIKNKAFTTVVKYGLANILKRKQATFDNMALFGSAGTGKTVVAKIIGKVYSRAGILLYPDVVELTGKDLTGTFIGESGKIMYDKLTNNLEKVVFIDEAYNIMSCTKEGERKTIDYHASSYGLEAIGELLKIVDDYRGKQIVIVAGYFSDMMDCFFAANEGLSRRFPNKLTLENYSSEQLVQIFMSNITDRNEMADADKSRFTDHLQILFDQNYKYFLYQAGDMLNLSDDFMTLVDNYKSDKNITTSGFALKMDELFSIMNGAMQEFIKTRKLEVKSRKRSPRGRATGTRVSVRDLKFAHGSAP